MEFSEKLNDGSNQTDKRNNSKESCFAVAVRPRTKTYVNLFCNNLQKKKKLTFNNFTS